MTEPTDEYLRHIADVAFIHLPVEDVEADTKRLWAVWQSALGVNERRVAKLEADLTAEEEKSAAWAEDYRAADNERANLTKFREDVRRVWRTAPDSTLRLQIKRLLDEQSVPPGYISVFHPDGTSKSIAEMQAEAAAMRKTLQTPVNERPDFIMPDLGD